MMQEICKFDLGNFLTTFLTTSLIAKDIQEEEFDHAKTHKMQSLGSTWQVIVLGRMIM
jgi:NitT/TauT family transport system permease protein